MKISPTVIFQKLCFQSKILCRLSYQWTLGFIRSFSRFWGLSVKISPTERSWNESIVSENMITYRYQWFFVFIAILSVKIVLSPAVSMCENRDLERKAHVILNVSWNFHRKKGYISKILRFEGFRGHPILDSLELKWFE